MSTDQIHIREAITADIPALFEIRTAATENAMTEAELAASGITPERAAELLRTDGRCWVAEAGDRIVGFCIANVKSASIWALFVLPAYEGLGIGRRLLEAAVDWLWRSGAEALWLETETNTRAEGFYEHLGWKRGEVERKDGYEEVRYTLKKSISTSLERRCHTLGETSCPMKFEQLPSTVREVCHAFVGGLEDILSANLHGIYMHGASVFPDSGPIQDVDCHVILEDSLRDGVTDEILQLQRDLSERFPPLGEELDAYFILYEDAVKTRPPTHQLQPEIRDESWSLHCAHIRAKRFITLYGPPPKNIFPAPSWVEITTALEHELTFIQQNLKYPDYCVLNMCRIMFSVRERNVVLSKFSCGKWASDRFPEWKPLIDAAVASYQGTKTRDEAELLKNQAETFVEFGERRIREQLRNA